VCDKEGEAAEREDEEAEEERDTESKTRTPHKDVRNKRSLKPSGIVGLQLSCNLPIYTLSTVGMGQPEIPGAHGVHPPTKRTQVNSGVVKQKGLLLTPRFLLVKPHHLLG